MTTTVPTADWDALFKELPDTFSDWNTNVRDTDEVLNQLSAPSSGDTTRPH